MDGVDSVRHELHVVPSRRVAPAQCVDLLWRAAGIAAALAVAAAPGNALAYRTLDDDPRLGLFAPARWEETPVRVALYAPELSPSELAVASDAVLGALGAWTSPDCTSFEAGFDGVVSSAAQAGDGRSTIELVSTAWVARGFPAGRGATTDVQLLVTEDGTAAIVEADIYVNFEEHSFVFGAPDGERLDFRAVVTHEVGHLLGLAHPCGELDAPVCDGTQVESALNPEYGGVRALSADDADGVCALYPVASCAPGCEDGAVCIQGVCERACTSPECSPSYCEGADCPGAVVCATDEDCRLGACSYLGPSEGTCVQAGATGTTCGSGDDCASLLCLESLQLHRRVCTTSCASDADCGDAQRCALLDGRKVCAPEERMTPNCSALAGGSGHHSGWTAGFLSAVTVLLALFARKREPS